MSIPQVDGLSTDPKVFGRHTCLIFHWITCSFWFENSVGNAYCFLSLKSGKISSLRVLYS